MTWYLTIRSDAHYSQEADTDKVTAFLKTISELNVVIPATFEAAPGMPWVSVVLAKADLSGNYSVTDKLPSRINVVELICSDTDIEWYDSLAIRIASFLGWQAIEIHEERVVHPAQPVR